MAQAPDSALARFPTFQHVVDLIRTNRDVKLLVEIEGGMRLAQYRPGRIEFVPAPGAAGDLAQRLGQRLQSWTGVRWAVTVVNEGGAPTIAETCDAKRQALEDQAREAPVVSAILAAFPGARIAPLKTAEEIAREAAQDALSEVEDEWDPFEED
jgi:DNA polymerase-3 subunit gamma/tau